MSTIVNSNQTPETVVAGPGPLSVTDSGRGAQPPRSSIESTSDGENFDSEWVYGYVVVLKRTLSCPPLPSHVESELMRRSR